MYANPEKFRPIVVGKKTAEKSPLKIGDINITYEVTIKLLGDWFYVKFWKSYKINMQENSTTEYLNWD